jgi:hypothetical protein
VLARRASKEASKTDRQSRSIIELVNSSKQPLRTQQLAGALERSELHSRAALWPGATGGGFESVDFDGGIGVFSMHMELAST